MATATPEQYTAAFDAAWQKVQSAIDLLPPFEQTMARGALRSDLIRSIVNTAVDAAVATPPAVPTAPVAKIGPFVRE